VPEHLEVGEVVGDALLFERGDEGVVGVEVGDDLEAAGEGDDLAFEMTLKDAEGGRKRRSSQPVESASM
jgi:hypothetical protein